MTPDEEAHIEAQHIDGQVEPRDYSEMYRERLGFAREHELWEEQQAENAALETAWQARHKPQPREVACVSCGRPSTDDFCPRCADEDARIFAADRPAPIHRPAGPAEAA